MEIIVISEFKLKIMLEKEDLSQFEISADELDYSNTETKRMFWDILNRVKHETGFDTDGQRVLVQLYPSKDGGCEMFVTKIGTLQGEEASAQKSYKEDTPIIQNKRRRKSQSQRKTLITFGFDKTEWLMCVCRRLSSIGYTGESSAYISDDGRSYLMLSDLDTSGLVPLDEYSFISEYGTYENTDSVKCFLGEHGRPMCESDAVALLGAL